MFIKLVNINGQVVIQNTDSINRIYMSDGPCEILSCDSLDTIFVERSVAEKIEHIILSKNVFYDLSNG